MSFLRALSKFYLATFVIRTTRKFWIAPSGNESEAACGEGNRQALTKVAKGGGFEFKRRDRRFSI